MEEADRSTIKRENVALSKDMDFVGVTSGLLARDIFENHHIEKFDSKTSMREKNMALLMAIETRGPRAFTSLVEALVESNQVHLAELLGYKSSGSSQGQMVQAQATPHDNRPGPSGQPTKPVPPVWHARDSTGDYSSTQMDASDSYPQTMVDSDLVYKMTSRPRGIALIINNKIFGTMNHERVGTDIDCRNLENVFTQLGFKVHVHKDLKGRDIQQIIEQLRKHDHTQFDCFIFAVLSHGIEGAVYGVDNCLVKIEDLTSQFGSDRCPTLNEKPKLFFLQTSRGEKLDEGVEARNGRPVPKTGARGDAGANDEEKRQVYSQMDDDPLPRIMLKERFDEGVEARNGRPVPKTGARGDAGANDQKKRQVYSQMESDSTDSFASSGGKVPCQSDMLLAYATVPGYVSWRSSERGSWFIQALTEVMLQHAKDEDLISMITMVNDRVARAFESSCGRHKQMPAPVTMLRKKLFFCPGHYE